MKSTSGNFNMHSVTYTEARNNLKTVLDETIEFKEPTLITRSTGGNCVVMGLDEYEQLVETAHLLSSPANVERLVKSIEQLSKGKTHERNLVE